MPNRIIKESICTSDNLDTLSWFEEVFFYRLIVCCDDYGRMDARPPILRARLFPLKTVTDTQIEKALKSLRSAAMIDIYEVDGRSFLQMRTWERHQQMRAKRSKYPAPESGVMPDDSNLQAHDIKCNQMISDDSICSRNPIQSESNPNPNSNPKRARGGFAVPSQEEVSAYFREKGSTDAEAQKFCDFYTSKGWKVGKEPMKDWPAAARGWISRNKSGGYGGQKPVQQENMRRYTPQERRATYSAAVIDFDEEGAP